MADETKPAVSVANLFKPKKYGIGAAREKAAEEMKNLDPTKCETKIGIVFDDSGSMSGDPIRDAKLGIQGFTANCNPKDVALSIFPLNKGAQPLTCNYDLLNMYVNSIPSSGGTPLYTVTMRLLETDITRGVLFSDGDPTDKYGQYDNEDEYSSGSRDNHEELIARAVAKKIPLDTVFIGPEYATGYKVMKDIADRTGGIFIHFKDMSSMSTGLKYLSPALRPLLMNEELKGKIQRGEKI